MGKQKWPIDTFVKIYNRNLFNKRKKKKGVQNAKITPSTTTQKTKYNNPLLPLQRKITSIYLLVRDRYIDQTILGGGLLLLGVKS